MTNNTSDLVNLFSIMPSPMALLDKDLRYIAVTKKYAGLYQHPEQAFTGKPFYGVPKRDLTFWKNIIEDVMSGNERVGIIDPYLTTDNQDSNYLITAKPWFSDNSVQQGILLTFDEKAGETSQYFTEERFKLFMDYFPGLCWITDNDNILRYANKQFFEVLRLSSGVIGRSINEIFGSDIAQNAHIKNLDVLLSKKNKEYYQTLRDEHGHPQYFKTYKFPFNDDLGRQNLVGAIAFDITKSTQLEDHLYQSDEQFRQVFEHSLIGTAIVSPEGKWERVNESLCNILGYTEAELQMMNMQDITHPEDLKKSVDFLVELNGGKKENIKCEKRYIHKDGSTIWVMLAATMLKDRHGKPLHYVSHIENITSRKEIEDNLILSEKKYRTIFENVQDVFYQTNQLGIVTEISPSIKLYSGYSREEVIGMPVANFYYYDQDRLGILELLRTEGSVIDVEVRLKTKNHQLKYASVNARILFDNGVFVATEGSMRDVTTRKFQENALKAMNTELTESNEQKNKLLSIIGHDLRNPISGSLQLLDLTLMDYESTSALEIHAYLSKMKQELGNANELLEELLSWAKVQFNSFSFNPVLIDDLAVLIQNCINKVMPMAINKGISLIVEVEGGLGITADIGMLETILRNLVSNAVKFTVAGDTVTITAKQADTAILFAVEDTGTGMSEESVGKLFNKNINYTTFGTSGEKGTGLGLSLCYDFVAKHGGLIWAESIVKQGSTFYFTIPQPGTSKA